MKQRRDRKRNKDIQTDRQRQTGVSLAVCKIGVQHYPSATMSAPLCSAAMALASGIPTRSKKHSAGSARIELYFS